MTTELFVYTPLLHQLSVALNTYVTVSCADWSERWPIGTTWFEKQGVVLINSPLIVSFIGARLNYVSTLTFRLVYQATDLHLSDGFITPPKQKVAVA